MSDCLTCDYPMVRDEVIVHCDRAVLTQFIDWVNRSNVRDYDGSRVTLRLVNDGRWAPHHAELETQLHWDEDSPFASREETR